MTFAGFLDLVGPFVVPGVADAAEWRPTARNAAESNPEAPLDGLPDGVLGALAATGARAKLRTGGLRSLGLVDDRIHA